MPESHFPRNPDRIMSAPQSHPKKKRRKRWKPNPRKIARLVIALAIMITVAVLTTHRKQPAEMPQPLTEAPAPAAETVTDFTKALDQMPEPTVKMKVNYFGNPREVFNDSNYIHLAEAKVIGIAPLSDIRSHWRLSRHITRVESCEDYYIDRLTFSRPYLVPEAEEALREIGHRFRDTIAARGGGDYRIKVTSLLRTPAGVKMLRRRNRNAIDSSVHRYATTFDISYASFIANSDTMPRSVDDLKGVLSEVLKAMREEGKIWVKYERKQPCFHITARRRKS